MQSHITHHRDHVGSNPTKFYRSTLFQGNFLQ